MPYDYLWELTTKVWQLQEETELTTKVWQLQEETLLVLSCGKYIYVNFYDLEKFSRVVKQSTHTWMLDNKCYEDVWSR
jgi:hypothetical protein